MGCVYPLCTFVRVADIFQGKIHILKNWMRRNMLSFNLPACILTSWSLSEKKPNYLTYNCCSIIRLKDALQSHCNCRDLYHMQDESHIYRYGLPSQIVISAAKAFDQSFVSHDVTKRCFHTSICVLCELLWWLTTFICLLRSFRCDTDGPQRWQKKLGPKV